MPMHHFVLRRNNLIFVNLIELKQMKQLLPIFIGVILFALSACQQETTYPLAMQQAESLMNTRPDSALHLLQGMADSIFTLPEEAQMYYHLLTIQAKDKQYITHTNDSLINRIVEFYEDYGDKERLMLAYYYQGSVYRDMNDAPRALKAFQQAMDLNVPNYDLQAKAYNQMGTLFMYQGLHDEVIRVNRKAMELYISQGKRNKISYFQRDIARMYDIKNMPDSALHYYQEACRTALADGDSVRYYGILGELGTFYYNIGKIDVSKETLTLLEKSSNIQYKTHIWLYLGHIYKDYQQTNTAKQYYQKVLQENDIYKHVSAHHALSNIAFEENDLIVGMKHLHKTLSLKDSIDRMTQTEAIAKINSLYNYQRIEAENTRLRLSRETYKSWTLALSIIILLALSFSVCVYLNKKLKKEHKLRISEFKKSELYKELWQASNEEDSETFNSPEKWTSIQEIMDTIYPDFTDKLYRLSPSLTPTELRVCWLTKIGLPPAGIARVLNLSKQAISNVRSKLSKKMQETDNATKNFDQLIEKL